MLLAKLIRCILCCLGIFVWNVIGCLVASRPDSCNQTRLLAWLALSQSQSRYYYFGAFVTSLSFSLMSWRDPLVRTHSQLKFLQTPQSQTPDPHSSFHHSLRLPPSATLNHHSRIPWSEHVTKTWTVYLLGQVVKHLYLPTLLFNSYIIFRFLAYISLIWRVSVIDLTEYLLTTQRSWYQGYTSIDCFVTARHSMEKLSEQRYWGNWSCYSKCQ